MGLSCCSLPKGLRLSWDPEDSRPAAGRMEQKSRRGPAALGLRVSGQVCSETEHSSRKLCAGGAAAHSRNKRKRNRDLGQWRQPQTMPELCSAPSLSRLFGSDCVQPWRACRWCLPLLKPLVLSLPTLLPGQQNTAQKSGIHSPHYFFLFSFVSFLLLPLFFNFLLCLGSCFVSSFLFLSLFKLTMEAFCPALLRTSFHSSSSPRIIY